jgi:hypothetical protein
LCLEPNTFMVQTLLYFYRKLEKTFSGLSKSIISILSYLLYVLNSTSGYSSSDISIFKITVVYA